MRVSLKKWASSVLNKRQVGPPRPSPWIRHWITSVLLEGHFALIQFKDPWINDILFSAPIKVVNYTKQYH